MSAPLHVAAWSGPRNISTAMMRAWENRGDCWVIDEPLYAHYLQRTGLDHPGREEVIAAGECDWRQVADQLTGPLPPGASLSYQKHMTHHLLPNIEREWLRRLTHVFLIRDPRRVLASYIKSRPNVVAADLGLLQQYEIYEFVRATGVTDPPIIDAGEFLQAPEAQLRALCERLGVDFSERMLRWPAGPRASDGVWAPYWYEQVYRSTGFEAAPEAEPRIPAELRGLVEELMPSYETLFARRLRT
jgi:hypothetical protein